MTEPAEKRPRGRPPKPPVATREAITVTEGADILAGMVRAELEDLGKLKATGTQRQNMIKRCIVTLKQLGELTGETLLMPESKIVRLPAFRRVADRMVEALAEHPEARKALAVALEKMARGLAAERTSV